MPAKPSSANTCAPRSAVSAATYPGPQSSSAWSARRCIASSRRWGWIRGLTMSRIAYVNGRYLPHRDARIHVEDRGYQFADGVYEVCEVREARLVDERRHMARLTRSLAELRIGLPMPLPALIVVLHQTVRRNRGRNGIVYLQITRCGAK